MRLWSHFASIHMKSHMVHIRHGTAVAKESLKSCYWIIKKLMSHRRKIFFLFIIGGFSSIKLAVSHSLIIRLIRFGHEINFSKFFMILRLRGSSVQWLICIKFSQPIASLFWVYLRQMLEYSKRYSEKKNIKKWFIGENFFSSIFSCVWEEEGGMRERKKLKTKTEMKFKWRWHLCFREISLSSSSCVVCYIVCKINEQEKKEENELSSQIISIFFNFSIFNIYRG